MANETYSLMGLKHATTEINGLTGNQIQRNIEDIVRGSGGAVAPTFAGIMSQKPGLQFSTLAIAEALSAIGLYGSAPASAEFVFQQNTLFGTRATTYSKVTPYKTLWVPRRLSAQHNQPSTLECYIYCFGDGSNVPLAFGTASGTYSQEVTELFTLGPQSLEGTDYEATSMDIDFGIEVEMDGHSGVPYPIWGYVKQVQPTITIKTNNFPKIATLSPTNAAGLTISDWTGYLRKVAEGGGSRVADATAEHIKIQCTEGVAYFTNAGGDHGNTMSVDITIKPTFDGTNAILQIDTTSAIE